MPNQVTNLELPGKPSGALPRNYLGEVAELYPQVVGSYFCFSASYALTEDIMNEDILSLSKG